MSRGKCVDCLHCEDAPPKEDGSWQGWCTFGPPTPAMIVGQGKPQFIGGPPSQQMTVIAIRPPVTETDSCASFESRDKPREIPQLGKAEPIRDHFDELDEKANP